jgi:hypothetical protein
MCAQPSGAQAYPDGCLARRFDIQVLIPDGDTVPVLFATIALIASASSATSEKRRVTLSSDPFC